jgi:hypothetical protein
VPKDKLTVNGPVKKWKGVADSGNAVYRWFCEECGSPIAHDPDAAPEIIALKGGSLATEIKKGLKPVCFYSLSSHVSCWVQKGNGTNEGVVVTGYRDLDRQQAALLPGAPGEALRAHAAVNAWVGYHYGVIERRCGEKYYIQRGVVGW